MDKQTVFKFFKGVGQTVSNHSPEILTGIGIVGMVGTVVLAVKATPKALEQIEEKKEELGLVSEDDLTVKETVQATWKLYIPAVATGVFATGCLIAANSVHAKRYAGLATAYQISTQALSEYREKVVETIGEKKERVVHDKIAEDRVIKNPPSTTSIMTTEMGGNTLCYDLHSGRYFKSDIDRIKRARNDLNYRMTSGMEMYTSLNEFYDSIGLGRTEIGDQLGWRIDNGQIEIHFGSFLTENDVPCVTIEYLTPPTYGFNKLY